MTRRSLYSFVLLQPHTPNENRPRLLAITGRRKSSCGFYFSVIQKHAMIFSEWNIFTSCARTIENIWTKTHYMAHHMTSVRKIFTTSYILSLWPPEPFNRGIKQLKVLCKIRTHDKYTVMETVCIKHCWGLKRDSLCLTRFIWILVGLKVKTKWLYYT